MEYSIPFEKVSLKEAKAALDGKPNPNTIIQNWQSQRKQQDPKSEQLADATHIWLDQLPDTVRPNRLVAQFPRIANRLAELWKRSSYCEKYLEDLLIDYRGGRRGFPPDVATELTALNIHFITHVSPPRVDIWGHRIEFE